jgi:hypothetical protein
MLFVSFVLLSVQGFAESKVLKGDDLETAQAMNDIYARHMLSSSCMERQKTYFIPYVISNQEKSSRMASFKKGCDCITNTILETYSPNDAIDYVTSTYGSVSPKQDKAKGVQIVQSNQQREKFAKMTYTMNVDKEFRQKCGFQK